MAVYALISKSPELMQRVQHAFDDAHYHLEELDVIFISSSMTTQRIADRLEIEDGEKGTYLIVGVEKYWGFGPKDLWEWIELQSA
jgi:hypothetical protein